MHGEKLKLKLNVTYTLGTYVTYCLILRTSSTGVIVPQFY